MRLDRAIEVLEGRVACLFEGTEEDWVEAQKLGIEALKRVKGDRLVYPLGSFSSSRLSGETKGGEQ